MSSTEEDGLYAAAARTFIGTPIFMSPEMFRQVPYGHKADIWALGCILYEMMALTEPFKVRVGGGGERVVEQNAKQNDSGGKKNAFLFP